MASFQAGGITEQLATTATAGGTTTLTVTSKQIQVFTGALGQILVLPDATTMFVGQKFEFYNQSSGSLTLNFNGGSAFTDASGTSYSTISPHTSLIIKLQTNGTSAGTWSVGAAAASAGSGSKNYLSAYTASTSSNTPNPGNGNFELGSTTGYSLANSALSSFIPTSTATPGTAFDSTHGGTAASGNLSFTTVTSGQLAGSASGSLVSSAASTVGDMLITKAFFIDLEDQAKMLTIKFYYTQHSGTALNFSGTSANTHAVWIYDVTNGAWIQPQGVYNLVQSSGTGYCTATFQTTSSSVQYQLALININASSGAYSLYVDDFFVGPQTAPMGPAMSDLSTQYQITPNGFGTVSGATYLSKRVGDSLMVVATWTNGTTAATVASLSLPAGLSIDATKLPTNPGGTVVGSYVSTESSGRSITFVASSSTYSDFGVIFYDGSTTSQVFLTFSSSGGGLQKQNANSLANSNQAQTATFTVPIAGWSSQTVMSNDTDTRVIAMSATTATVSSGGVNTPIVFGTTLFDNVAAYNSSTGRYTVQVSGYYDVEAFVYQSNHPGALAIYKNGTLYSKIGEAVTSTGDGVAPVSGGGKVQASAGDIIDVRLDLTITGAGPGTLSISRLSGPATIAATESVNARYHGATASLSSSDSPITYTTKDFDSHNAYSGSTYTAPVSGKYQINAGLITTDVSGSFNSGISIYKNGVQISQTFTGTTTPVSATNNWYNNISDIVSCLAGDSIVIEAKSIGSTTPSIVSSTVNNWFTIARVGN